VIGLRPGKFVLIFYLHCSANEPTRLRNFLSHIINELS